MAESNPEVMKMIEAELKKNPDISNPELLEKAKKIDKGVGKLSPRQFNAMYPLQVKRAMKPARPRKRARGSSRKAGPCPGGAAVPGPGHGQRPGQGRRGGRGGRDRPVRGPGAEGRRLSADPTPVPPDGAGPGQPDYRTRTTQSRVARSVPRGFPSASRRLTARAPWVPGPVSRR